MMAIFTLLAQSLLAAEVANIQLGQSDDRAFAQYDLIGEPGEKQADVSVAVEIAKKRYSSERLKHLSGDIGKDVKVGLGKRIWWDLLKDMPTGWEGEIVWDIEASKMPDEPPPTVRDAERDLVRKKAELVQRKFETVEKSPLVELQTESKQKQIVDVDVPPPSGKKAGKYDIAVVIGNRDYAPHADNVDFALRDAGVMKEYLTTLMGFDPRNILYYENANLSQFFNLFGTRDEPRGKLADYVKAGESRVFIYYAGHGVPDVDSGESYFVPVGAEINRIKVNGYRQRTLYDNLSQLGAKSITLVLEASFSGMTQTGSLVKGISGLMKIPQKTTSTSDLILITSCANDQVSSWYPEKQHGLFTYYFLKGLRGEADNNGDGTITVAEMKAWLSENVHYMARRLTGKIQTPLIIGNDNSVLVNLSVFR
jgi:hypothetical protein